MKHEFYSQNKKRDKYSRGTRSGIKRVRHRTIQKDVPILKTKVSTFKRYYFCGYCNKAKLYPKYLRTQWHFPFLEDGIVRNLYRWLNTFLRRHKTILTKELYQEKEILKPHNWECFSKTKNKNHWASNHLKIYRK